MAISVQASRYAEPCRVLIMYWWATSNALASETTTPIGKSRLTMFINYARYRDLACIIFA